MKTTLYLQKNNQTIALKLTDSRLTSKHRPSRLLRNLIDVGMEQGLFDSNLIKIINVHGLEKNYWMELDLLKRYQKEWDEEE